MKNESDKVDFSNNLIFIQSNILSNKNHFCWEVLRKHLTKTKKGAKFSFFITLTWSVTCGISNKVHLCLTLYGNQMDIVGILPEVVTVTSSFCPHQSIQKEALNPHPAVTGALELRELCWTRLLAHQPCEQ